jgi:hypothetical protein
VAYVGLTVRWLVAPLGLSHDGRNAATFASAARGMRRLGLGGSRLGSVLADGNAPYAHHPPSLVWAIRAVQAVAGESPWTARLPTWLASIAVIWLLHRLLRDLGLGAWSAAIGTTVAVACPMFLLFGWMADTPMWSLPAALVATRCWVRAGRRTDGPSDGAVATAAAAWCALAGWQAVLWCGLLVVLGWRDRRVLCRRLAWGLAGGLAVTVAWIAASPDGLAGLVEGFSTRAAGTGQGVAPVDAIRANLGYARELWSPLVLVAGLPASWLAARDRRVRRTLAVAVVGVVGYAVLFWEAAGLHPYWNLWAVVPIALAVGSAVDRMATTAARRSLCAAAALAMLAVAPLAPSESRAHLEAGGRLGEVVARTALPAGQPGWLLSGLPGSETWISYVSDRPVTVIDDRAELDRLAVVHPGWRVVLPCRTDGRDRCAAMGRDGAVVNGVAVTTVDAVADTLESAAR